MHRVNVFPVASPRTAHRHVGIEVVLPQWQGSLYLSTTPSNGVAWFSREQFSQGQRVYRIDKEPGWNPLLSPEQMLHRIRALTPRPYGLLSFNCEHLAKSIIGQPIESPQLQVVIGMAAVLLLARSVQ